MHDPKQPDLFTVQTFTPPPLPAHVPEAAPETLSDAELVAAIPEATQRSCHALAAEAVRRRLAAAVPALATLCQRFRGFNLSVLVAEQAATLPALAAIGGGEAKRLVQEMLMDGTVDGPALRIGLQAATALGVRLPREAALPLLRHEDAGIRAVAARCVRVVPATADMLIQMLSEADRDVALAAAYQLGEAGRAEALPVLLGRLGQNVTVETIEAIAPIADEATLMHLGRIARGDGALSRAARKALEESDHPRAEAILRGIGSK